MGMVNHGFLQPLKPGPLHWMALILVMCLSFRNWSQTSQFPCTCMCWLGIKWIVLNHVKSMSTWRRNKMKQGLGLSWFGGHSQMLGLGHPNATSACCSLFGSTLCHEIKRAQRQQMARRDTLYQAEIFKGLPFKPRMASWCSTFEAANFWQLYLSLSLCLSPSLFEVGTTILRPSIHAVT